MLKVHVKSLVTLYLKSSPCWKVTPWAPVWLSVELVEPRVNREGQDGALVGELVLHSLLKRSLAIPE